MGISMAGSDAFNYNRFEALDQAYHSLYENKEEDDVSEKEEKAIKDEVKKHTKDHHEDESDEDDSEEKDSDDEEESDDKEKSDKKFPSFLKKSKEEKEVKEAVIAYLMDEGFANNEVSAEVMAEHMSPAWVEKILQESKFDERGRPKSGQSLN